LQKVVLSGAGQTDGQIVSVSDYDALSDADVDRDAILRVAPEHPALQDRKSVAGKMLTLQELNGENSHKP
jgi:hypothetical protein